MVSESEPKPQNWRWLAARFQLGPQSLMVNIICCEPQKTKNHQDVFFFKGGGAQKTEIMKIVSIRSLRVLHLNRRWQLNFPWKCMLDLYPSNSNDRFFFRLYSYESSWPLFYLFKLNSYQVHKWGEMELGRLGLKNGSIVYLRSQICFALWKLTDCQAGDDYVMWNNRHSQIYFS